MDMNLLMEEIREQRKDTKGLNLALSQTALQVERLTNKVDQVHKDLSSIGDLLERITKIELSYEGLKTKVAIYSAAIGATASLLLAWGFSIVSGLLGA